MINNDEAWAEDDREGWDPRNAEWCDMMIKQASDISSWNSSNRLGTSTDLIGLFRVLLETYQIMDSGGSLNVDSIIKKLEMDSNLNQDNIVDLILAGIRQVDSQEGHLNQRVIAILRAFTKLSIDPKNPKRCDRKKVMQQAIDDNGPAIITESTATKAYQECINLGLVNKIIEQKN